MELLRAHNVAPVVADRPEITSFQSHDLTADFTFARFHHGTRGHRGKYSRSELEQWSKSIRTRARKRDVYAYFNNDWEGFAPANAADRQRLI